jgi:hypothetical protein
MTTGTERRGHPRVQAELPIQLTAEGGAADASIRDISLSGVCCLTDRAMPVMTQVRLTIVLPDRGGAPRPITCSGAVVRSRRTSRGPSGAERYETAIFFTELGESARNQLEDYVVLRRSGEITASEGAA